MADLDRYRLPLNPAPGSVLAAIAAGVREEEFEGPSSAERLLGGERPPADGVLRAPDGRIRVTCTTDMPGVTPAMIDWWFAWHLPSSERYRLWHPQAHRRARLEGEGDGGAGRAGQYVGKVSLVDEQVGDRFMKLAIAFVPPAEFGIRELERKGATAVCAYTTDRRTHGRGGCVVHYVVPVPGGAQMRSSFWLGEVRHEFALVRLLLGRLLNSRPVRRRIFSDRMALGLLRHCGEEMNHLPRLLPRLYAEVAGPPAS